MRTITPTRRAAALAVLTFPVAVGANATATGPATTDDPVVLRMARTAGFADAQIDHFMGTVAELSGGDLAIEIATEWDIGSTDADLEQQIVGAVADGDIDLGWVGSRAFGELGVTSFDALTAPLLVDSYELQAAILDSDLPERMLDGLDDIGITGLALVAGGLRKPIGVDGPLLGPADYAGATVYAFPHGGHDPALIALGATPISGTFLERNVGLVDGSIDGYENTLLFFASYQQLAPHITLNVNLWPAMGVVFTDPDSMAALDDAQQGWLRAALADTVARSVEIADVDALVVAGPACANGARFATASDDDLAALRDAVEPVYAELRTDPDTAAFIGEIEALRDSISAEPLTAPDGCAAAAAHSAEDSAGDERLPDGIYRSAPVTAEMAKAALSARGLPESASDYSLLGDGQSVVFTLDIGSGTLTVLESRDGGPEALTFQGAFEVVDDGSFTVIEPGSDPLSIQFDYDGQTLTSRWALTDGEIQQLFASTSAPYVTANIVATAESAPYTRVEVTEASTDESVTLRMGSPYDDPARRYTPAVFHFVDKVAELSGGNLKIEMVYRFEDDAEAFSVQPDGEQQVVEALAAGDFDLAWAGTRVFDTFGLTRFAALHAPLLVDSYPLQAAIIASDLDDEMLAELEEIDVTGLAILAGGLRKPIGVAGPLLNPDDFAGITFQLYRSDTQAAAVTALGATPTDVTAAVRDAGIVGGEIQGIEHTLRTYAVRNTAALAPYVAANVNLWPETTVLLANPDSLDGLTDTQLGWLQEAAADAAQASTGLHDRDADFMTFACAQGASFAVATDADLAALRKAVEPVYAALEQDPETRELIEQITALKATVEAQPLAVPDGCTGGPQAAADRDDPSVIDGVYRFAWTVEELVAAGVPQELVEEFGLAGTWRWTFQDGTVVWLNEDVEGDGCPLPYDVSGNVVNMHPSPPDAHPACPQFLFTATWELTDDALVLSDVLLNGAAGTIVDIWLGTKPMTRIE